MAVDRSFLAFFLDEAADILAGWERSCLEIEQGQQGEAVESLYRAAHNLKSGSAAVGLAELSHVVHQVEDLMSRLLHGKVTATPELIRLFLEAHTLLTKWFAELRNNADYQMGAAAQALEREIQRLKGGPETAAADDPIAAAAAEVAAAAAAPVELAAPPEPVVAAEAAVGEAAKPQAPAAARANPTESVRVAANKLDMLIQLVGELATQQAIVWHGRQNGTLHSKGCDNAIQLMQKNAKDLQGLALALRMQPLQSLFQRLSRASSDLARSQGKKIEVVCTGDHVELDRAVVERITEALMHVIRNAVDHGVEAPEARQEQGKGPVATLTLAGAQEPGGILITIRDDGRGLNTERILQKALEKGLARADQKYTDSEIQSFIFMHGFSTAEKVTSISGRGVGMDVVKSAVQGIGGSIAVSSRFGHGTSFAISLPTTLSIVDALIVEVDESRYAVPVQDVSEIIDLGAYTLEMTAGRGRMLLLRDSVVPVEALTEHLPARQQENPHVQAGNRQTTTIRPALLVRLGAQGLAFEVDRILGQQPVSVRPLPGGLDLLPGYIGSSILGDGDPCVILNIPALARRHSERLGTQAATLSTDPQSDGFGKHESNDDRYLIFRIGGELLATPLPDIHEILSDLSCSKILGAPRHVAGCVDVRGQVLTVIDLGIAMGLAPAKATGPMVVIGDAESPGAVMVDRIEAVATLETVPSPGDRPVVRYNGHILSVIDLRSLVADVSTGLRSPQEAMLGSSAV